MDIVKAIEDARQAAEAAKEAAMKVDIIISVKVFSSTESLEVICILGWIPALTEKKYFF